MCCDRKKNVLKDFPHNPGKTLVNVLVFFQDDNSICKILKGSRRFPVVTKVTKDNQTFPTVPQKSIKALHLQVNIMTEYLCLVSV